MIVALFFQYVLLAFSDESRSHKEDLLTEIYQIRTLTPDEANESRLVQITGTVTLSNPHRPEMFVQDQTGGIFVQGESLPAEIHQGSSVRINGRSSKGFFSPYVNATQVEILGESPLPPPASFNLSQNDSRWLDAHCVLSHGLVRDVIEIEGRIRVSVEGTGGSGFLEFREEPALEDLQPFIGTVVRIRGVCVPDFDDDWNVTGNVRLILQSISELTLIESVERLAAAPIRSIRDLRKFVPAVSPIPFARIAGVVTSHPLDDVLLVQDNTGGCAVRLRRDSIQELAPGTRVEVAGFLAWVGNHVELKSAVAKRVGSSRLPEPHDVFSASELGEANACRVRLSGKIATVSHGRWTVVGDHGTVVVRVPSEAGAGVESGSEVSVVGVVTSLFDDSSGFELLPLTSRDLVVTSFPARPMITGTRLAVAVSAGALLILVTVFWVLMLRRSVYLRTQQLSAANATLEQRVADRTSDLAAANKELESFCYSVSHDLRAPLRSIDGFSKAVQEDYQSQLDGEGVDFLRRIRSAANRMGELIDDLLELSRVSRADLHNEHVNLTDLVEEVILELRQSEPCRELNITVGRNMVAQGDKGLLKIVLSNLVGNAWKYTSKTENAHISCGCENRNGIVVYSVRDNGSGFDSTYAHKLFEPFQRLHRDSEFPGHGIGLATVRRIIRRHGGQVSADGNIGQGSVFRFTLQKHDIRVFDDCQL